jgi:hypothetical protein
VAIPAAAQITTGSVSGTVKDAQGGLIPGATVVLVSETQGRRSIPVVSNETGDFAVVNLAADTYTIEISLPSFKTLRRLGVAVSPGERVAVGSLTLEIGTTSEVVDVSAEAPLLQAASGERSFAVEMTSIQNLPIAGRGVIDFVSLTPGVDGTTRAGDRSSTGGGNSNVMMDGVSTMDTGSNRVLININVESIGEVKVLTSGYQAEYGRSSGLQITAVTKSGTNRFHGGVYDVERDSDWYANSKTNILNGDPKTVLKQRDWGYSIGGPVGKPGGNNKLFFFYAQEFEPRTGGNNVVRHRMPTLLERNGDFSQSRDNTGALYPYIKDPRVNGTCSAASQAACFADGGVLGRIPADQLYQTGLNILRMYPLPNIDNVPPGQAYNFETRRPQQDVLGWQPVFRIDYQPVSSLRGSFKYAGFGQREQTLIGTIPGWNDTRDRGLNAFSIASTVNYTVNPTTFIEVTYGHAKARQHGSFGVGTGGGPQFYNNAFSVSPTSNRFDMGLGDLPMLFPEATIIDPNYYIYELLNAGDSPMWDGTRSLRPPSFSWGNRVANAPPNIGFPTYNTAWSHDISFSVTRVMGRHTIKSGFYNTYSFKAQGGGDGGASINFQQDAVGTNPFDTSFGFANAAIGAFSSYSQQSKSIEGAFVYNNTEGYIQDNWKVNPRLTLDYGVRLVHQQPQYDKLLQSSNFFPERWIPTDAPLLYVAGCFNGVSPCSGTNRRAMNPATGEFLGPNSTLAIGTLVPDSGNRTNGLVQSGQGIAKTTYTWPSLGIAPRFGMAYDVTGAQRLVLRGAFGLYFDRPSGNSVFGQRNNPPASRNVTVRYSQLQTLGSGGLVTEGPPSLSVFAYDDGLPSSTQWNAGLQMALPWSSSLDVGYVGQHGFNVVEGRNLNAVDFGTAFLLENQDLTRPASATPGATAVVTDQMRAFRGYGSISQNAGTAWITDHSLQLTFTRRFRNGLSFGFTDTIAMSSKGNTPQRLEHHPDGSITVRSDQAEADRLLGNRLGSRHRLKGNFVWDLPDLDADGVLLNVVAAVINDWQFSGIWTAETPSPYTVGFSYQSGGSSVNLTGSPDYAARVRLIGDPGSGCSDDPYRQYNALAFAGPLVNSVGLESGNNYLRGCFENALDLSIARTIRLGGGRSVQLRVDIFNVPNAAGVTGRNTTISLNNPDDPITQRNLPFNPDGTLVQSRLLPRGAGTGVVTGYQSPRTVQAQARFSF